MIDPRLQPRRATILALEPNWWLVALRGLFALVLAIAAFLVPQPTVAALGLVFGFYALFDGGAAIVAALRRPSSRTSRLPLLLEGLAGLIVGVLILVLPGAGTIAVVALVAVWSILTGVFELLVAARLRLELPGEILTLLGGLASLALGVLLLVFPRAGVTAVAWLIGAYALVYGVLMLLLALRLRGRHELAQGPTGMSGRLLSPTDQGAKPRRASAAGPVGSGEARSRGRQGLRQGNGPRRMSV